MARIIYLLLAFIATAAIQAADAANERKNPPHKESAEDKPLQETEYSESKKNDALEELILTPAPDWKDKEPTYYRIPKAATKGISGVGVPYTLWYDHFLWDESESLNEHAEKSFYIPNDNVYAIIVTDKNQIALDDLDDIVIKNAKQSGFEHAKITTIEKRKINGNDVVFMHWNALLQGISIDFLSYLYSGPKGSVFLHTYTPSSLYKKNERHMESFLNGFTLETK